MIKFRPLFVAFKSLDNLTPNYLFKPNSIIPTCDFTEKCGVGRVGYIPPLTRYVTLGESLNLFESCPPIPSRPTPTARLYWGLCCSRWEPEQTTVSLACSLLGGRGGGDVACSLHGVRVWVCPGVRPEGWLRCFTHPLGSVVCRGHAQYPAFAPGSSKLAVGFFGLFVSFVQNLPQLRRNVVIFSPIQFLCILLLEERCVQVQVLQHYSKGSQVPTCLIPP